MLTENVSTPGHLLGEEIGAQHGDGLTQGHRAGKKVQLQPLCPPPPDESAPACTEAPSLWVSISRLCSKRLGSRPEGQPTHSRWTLSPPSSDRSA